MSSKNNLKHRKDSQIDHKRMEEMEKARIIQDNLVFISGLPLEIADPKLLTRQQYFGRYGRVQKVVINSPPGFKKNCIAQAYITFNCQLQASLAIVALDGFNFDEKPLKVSYGTTKYCTYFVRGNECPNSDCFYLHKIDKSREVVGGDPRNNFQQQNDRAFDYVNDHLEEVIDKMAKSQEKYPEEGFPTLTEMIEFLIDSKFLEKSEVDQLMQKHKKIKPQAKKEVIITVTKQKSVHDGRDSSTDMKLNKCNSFSTMASPVKSQIEQKVVLEKAQKTQSPVQKIEKIEKPQSQIQKTVQNKFQLQQKVEKMLIKKLYAGTTQKSKLGFVSGASQKQPQELKKLKRIVEKCLIAKN